MTKLPTTFVGTVPLFLVVLEALLGGPRPTVRACLGIALGLLGVAVLVRPSGHDTVDRLGALALLIAAISWSYGTLFGRRADLPKNPLLTTGMEGLAGGAILIIAGLVTGEATHFSLAAVSRTSLLGLTYLITLGTVVGYSAYTYLVTATTPARLGTYAYVNPVIAVILGAGFAGEPITPVTVLAIGMILSAVVILTLKPRPASTPAPRLATDS